jgi:hypothetical protein
LKARRDARRAFFFMRSRFASLFQLVDFRSENEIAFGSLYPGDALPSNFSRLIHAREHASPPTLDNHPVSARIPRRRLL